MRPRTFLLAALLAAAVAAAETEEPLDLDTVLDRSARHAPKILGARAKVAQTEAKRLGAEGAFDRKVEVDSSAYLNGFYSGRQLDSKLVRPFRNLGGEAFAGYRLSGGSSPDFPVYEDELVTLSAGEVNFGATLALLRDREFDRRRFALAQTELDVEMARLDLLLSAIEVQHDAMRAYWDWVEAGQRLEILRNLLENAEDRVTALSLRLNEGDVAQIDIVENAQRILLRRSLVVNADKELENAAIKLSLYNRNADGLPLVPDRSQLPARIPRPDDPEAGLAEDLESAMARQAELELIERRLEKAANLKRLGENELLPQVDFGVKVARDFGSGSPSRDETDLVIGFEVSVPLERRKARGEIAAARAQIEELSLTLQGLEEQIVADIERLYNIIDASLQTAFYARLEVQQAQRLEDAEWIRFEEGASNFFLLNLREESTADARLRNVSALAAYHRAVADYLAITADAEALRVLP